MADAGLSAKTEVSVHKSANIPDPILPGEPGGAITYFRVRSRYSLPQGKIAMPCANVAGAPGKGLVHAQVHIPTAALMVDWVAWKKGSTPDKPSPSIAGPVLLFEELDLDNAEVECDDRLYLISSGTYYYAWTNRAALTLSHPLPPYIELPNKSQLVPNDSDFMKDIIEAAW